VRSDGRNGRGLVGTEISRRGVCEAVTDSEKDSLGSSTIRVRRVFRASMCDDKGHETSEVALASP
jgi:hypothetical protein